MAYNSAVDLLLVVAKFVLLGVPASWMAVVAYGLLTGQINTNGLVTDKQTGALSAHRVQMLLATLAAAGYALGRIAGGDSIMALAAPTDVHPLLAAFGASHGLYLFAKHRESTK
jgi:hypothetical protein